MSEWPNRITGQRGGDSLRQRTMSAAFPFTMIAKDPTERRDYVVDFTDDILDATDLLAACVVAVRINHTEFTESGLTFGAPVLSGQTARYRISGGNVGSYILIFSGTTVGGALIVRSGILPVVSQAEPDVYGPFVGGIGSEDGSTAFGLEDDTGGFGLEQP